MGEGCVWERWALCPSEAAGGRAPVGGSPVVAVGVGGALRRAALGVGGRAWGHASGKAAVGVGGGEGGRVVAGVGYRNLLSGEVY